MLWASARLAPRRVVRAVSGGLPSATATVAAVLVAAVAASSGASSSTSSSLAAGSPLGRVELAAATPVPSSFSAVLTSDLSGTQWSLAATNVAQAWSKATGAGVIVAEVDTGIDASRPDLAGRVVTGAHRDFATGKLVSGNRTDTYSHGTHVAGIIAGSADGHGISGVAPEAKLMPINVDLGPFGIISGQDLADGITYGVDHGAQVINLSMGLVNLKATQSEAKPVCDAVANAVSHNVVIVAAAGNDGDSGSIPIAPATCPGAISVAAVDHTLKITSWSSYDGTVSVAAPGAAIFSTVPTTTNASGFANYSGTSMATPFVSGIAALLRQEHPTWTVARIKQQIEDTAMDAGPAGTDPVYGHGIVDVAAAVGATAPPPRAVPFVQAWGIPFVSSEAAGALGQPDETLVTWRPDADAKVTGYTVTAYTASGAKTTETAADQLRLEIPVIAGGFSVVAHTSAGDVTSPPVWNDPYAYEAIPQVQKPLSLTAIRQPNGSLKVAWRLPDVDLDYADNVYVYINDLSGCQTTVQATTGSCLIAKNDVPPGDLVIDAWFASRDIHGATDVIRTVNALVPFSGRAVKAGKGRYSVTLDLARSWAKKACNGHSCGGVAIDVSCGKTKVRGYVNRNLQVPVTLKCPVQRTPATRTAPARTWIVVKAWPAHAHKKLRMAKVRIAIG